MSQTGNYTPLQLNVLAALSKSTGIGINAGAIRQQGEWLPTGYIPGSVVTKTVLSKLTASIPNFYQMAVDGRINFSTYRKLFSIGSATVPALGNSRPAAFKPSYAGYGSWVGGTMQGQMYPPRNYPTSGEYSYIYQQHGGYAYLMGWPGVNSWQQTTDTYQAAYVPEDAENTVTSYDGYFQNGFVATIARQAFNELWFIQFTQYNAIVNSFSQTANYRLQKNGEIASLAQSRAFMPASFSNLNDLTTNDISGVTQAFRLWGNDLLNCGRAIDLAQIHKFGTPSVLLITLQNNGAVTQAVSLALQYAGLDSQELNRIFDPTYTPTPAQEKKIYEAFKLVSGPDLYSTNSGITFQLNCKLNTLRTLADLLDPRYLFPTSYLSLTVPQYRSDTPSSKIYYFIYVNGGVNPQVKPLGGVLGTNLTGIIPDELATACSALSVSIQQIKNVMQIDVQKFALSVRDLELTTKGLPLLNTPTVTAVDLPSVDQQLAEIALGSGNNGTYRQCDFFGAVSNYPYDSLLETVENTMVQLPVTQLAQTYASLLTLSQTAPPTPPDPPPDPPPSPFDPVLEADLLSLIAQANTRIAAIYASNRLQCTQINYAWESIGRQLFIEQRAIPYAITQSTNISQSVEQSDFQSFAKSLPQYGLDNAPGENAQTLERISNVLVLGGQSIIGAMREARNAERLGWAGAPPDNDVPNTIDICCASAKANLNALGQMISIEMTNPATGYTLAAPPEVNIYPYGYGGSLTPVIEADGSISTLLIDNPGVGYPYVTIVIDSPLDCVPSADTGNTIPPSLPEYPNEPTFPGPGPFTQFADNPYIPGPPPLPPPADASSTVDEAIADVTICNCDCWNM